tara:strand:+ start:3495 stop:5531 length:2037 start_codon:yes stop_codon:yes gene_type:complete
MSKNLLAGETSPYLLQHRDNPVHWMPWGQAALDQARAENKPILLSVGYAACHWCHVMAHESFENEDVARVMNENFINIKVDREERPDVDQIYQTALSLLGQQNGYPLTMFLTPDGEPFWGGTYFPRESRYGLPGFPDLLKKIAEIFHASPQNVDQNRTALMTRLRELSENNDDPAFGPAVIEQAANNYLKHMDPVHGGLGRAPKFPQPPILTFLWHRFLRTGEGRYRDTVLNSLIHICQGGLYDHVGGGFARYCVDERWLVPHFEKMLYDNALLISLLSDVWAMEKLPLFRDRIYETIDWVFREMTCEEGGFAAALDADSDGEEGKYYVWQHEELDEILDPGDLDFLKRYYDASETGNWEGKIILNRLHHLSPLSDEHEKTARQILRRLHQRRRLRIPPGRDDKILTDWNGLMIEALATAGRLFEEADWIQAAEKAWRFIHKKMIYQKDGQTRLYHSFCRGQPSVDALLEDYANIAAAGLKLYEVTGKQIYLTDTLYKLDLLDQYYWDPKCGGYFQTASDAETLILRSIAAYDNVVPAGNNVMIRVLSLAALLTGNEKWRTKTESLIRAFSADALRNFYPYACRFDAYDFHLQPLQIVLVGKGDKTPWKRAVLEQVPAQMILLDLEEAAGLPPGHPAAGKTSAPQKITAYLCEGSRCSVPLTQLEEFIARLRQVRPAL